eukprot:TRINITY_DN467_c0_g2_i1.p1 TRINITY_DN467_c0_g2~~TRINITY_DN467_c0_g2_i1.p1  ORF type:complete len:379 (+),score=64.76 TRINITY_DN467_c0_g2_i1:70-1206(+)
MSPPIANSVVSYPATEWRSQKGKSKAIEYPTYDLDKPQESFLAIREMLITEVTKELPVHYAMPKHETKWVNEMLKYNLEGGKMNRGLMTVTAGVQLFESMGLELDNDTLCKFAVLGWCIEWTQAWLLMIDDIMDSSETRRGQPCWYKRKDVGLLAINDGFMTEMLTYKILKNHFKNSQMYPQLLDLFFESTFQTECGQLLDTMCCNLDLSSFTVDRWELIVTYKTAFYSFYLPVACAMILAGITEESSFDTTRSILIDLGVYFQAQDDYLDCFAPPEVLGKIGTDIQDKKCSWLFTQAYCRATDEEKDFLNTHYGNCTVGSDEEAQIKDLFRKMELPQLFEKYEQESYDKVMSYQHTPNQVPWAVFEIFLKKIYKRSK